METGIFTSESRAPVEWSLTTPLTVISVELSCAPLKYESSEVSQAIKNRLIKKSINGIKIFINTTSTFFK